MIAQPHLARIWATGRPSHSASRRAPPKRPVLLASIRRLSEGAALWVPSELADPVGAVEVRRHQDVEQLSAGSGPRATRRSLRLLHLLEDHFGTLCIIDDRPRRSPPVIDVCASVRLGSPHSPEPYYIWMRTPRSSRCVLVATGPQGGGEPMIQSVWRRRLLVKAGLAVGAVFVMTVTSTGPVLGRPPIGRCPTADW
jgi:hypothetical protein